MKVQVGDRAPDFKLTGHDDREYRLADLRGRFVVLVFYPLDFSPVCSRELGCICAGAGRFEELGARLLGISVDSAWTHKAFANQLGLDFPLLADFHPRGEVARRYGVYHDDKGISGRAIVVIDPEGTIAEMRHYELSEVPSLEPVLQSIGRGGGAAS
jgi:peroxiredoxin